MQGLFGLLLTLVPLSIHSAEASLLEDAFHAEVKVRKLEEEETIVRNRRDLEDELKVTELQKISKSLDEARSDLKNILRNDQIEISEFEKIILARAKAQRKKSHAAENQSSNSLEFLIHAFPKTREWSPVEWQLVGDWFGQSAQDALLKTTFETTKKSVPSLSFPKGTLVVWVKAPLAELPIEHEAKRLAVEKEKLRDNFLSAGFRFEELEVSPFSRLEDQIEGLHLALANKLNETAPFLLISSGTGSALLLHAFDLNPGLLARKEILGWLNFNGRLYGQEEKVGRKPASQSKAERPEFEAQQWQMLLRQERLNTQTPLKPNFPVWNLVSVSPPSRPGSNLRESLLPEGQTFFLSKGTESVDFVQSLPWIFQTKSH